jgi:hypothetical protein
MVWKHQPANTFLLSRITVAESFPFCVTLFSYSFGLSPLPQIMERTPNHGTAVNHSNICRLNSVMQCFDTAASWDCSAGLLFGRIVWGGEQTEGVVHRDETRIGFRSIQIKMPRRVRFTKLITSPLLPHPQQIRCGHVVESIYMRRN